MARVAATLALIAYIGLGVIAGSAISGTASAQAPAPAAPPASEKGAVDKAAAEKAAKAAAKKEASARKKAAEKKSAEKKPGEGSGETKADPAAVLKALDTAQKALDGGKPEQTVNQVNALVTAGGLDSKSMARALSLRGQAYRKQGKPAQAISDLQSALWLKGGLGDADRAVAQQARSEAYREAGVSEPAQAGGKGQGQGATRAASATGGTPPSSPITTAAVGPKAETGTPSGGNFFSNLFGGGQKEAAKQAATAPTEAVAVKALPSQPAVSSWSEGAAKSGATAEGKTAVKKAAPEAKTAIPVQAVEPQAAPLTKAPPLTKAAPLTKVASAAPAAATADSAAAAKAGGKFRVQLAAVRSKAEAQVTLDKAKAAVGGSIGQRTYEVQEATFGNMGTFFRGQIGMFSDESATNAICATLRAKDLDCVVTAN